MSLPEDRTYTIEDIYNLPEGQRAELIDGQIYMMSPPKRIHQKISGWLFKKIVNYIDERNGNCEVYSAPFAVFINKDESEYVEPDISVICDKDKLDDKGCTGAPDFIIEIISPSTASRDYITKLNLYKSAGVREYWIINPADQSITIYFFDGDIWANRYTFRDRIKVNIYDDLYLNFSELNLA